MNFNEIAFVVLIGAGFILLIGLSSLFNLLINFIFHKNRKMLGALSVTTSVVVSLGALTVGVLAWFFI